jgi:tripartite-type tricarboxylate transporter receptor subunit TctC
MSVPVWIWIALFQNKGETMMLRRVAFLAVIAVGSICPALAQPYPSRPIRLVAPYEPGGGVDITARLVAKELAQVLGQAVTVENRPGAGGVVGTQAVVSAAPDGYTLLLASTSPIVIAPFLVKNISYNPQKDLLPIALVANNPAILLVKPSSPIHTLAELIAMAKEKPGSLTYSSSGIGGTGHLSALMLKVMAGTDMLHVPYKGTGPALTAVLSGEVSMTVADSVAGLKFVQSGQLRAVAVTMPTRIPALPDVPAIGEALPGYSSSVWYGVFAPAKTPDAIVTTLGGAMAKVLKSPGLVNAMKAQGTTPIGGSTESFAKFIEEERARWEKVILASGLRPE